MVQYSKDSPNAFRRHRRRGSPPAKIRKGGGAAPLKTAKEPVEKHRLEPYFNFGGRKFFNHMNPEKPNFNPETPSQEQGEVVKSPQEIAWENNRAEVDKITDRLGLGIDEKIKESVAAFRVHEFTTSQSCEGHTGEEEKHGASFPWVEVYAPEPKGWREAKGEKKKELDREWTIKNLEQQQKMMGFLTEFYQGRETPFDARLAFDRIGAFGGFRVQSFGAEMMKLLPPEEQLQKLDLYRKEMNDFTEFLKGKHFSKE